MVAAYSLDSSRDFSPFNFTLLFSALNLICKCTFHMFGQISQSCSKSLNPRGFILHKGMIQWYFSSSWYGYHKVHEH